MFVLSVANLIENLPPFGFIQATTSSTDLVESEVSVSGSSSDGGASVVVGAPLGCYEDSPESRVFEKIPGSFASGSDVSVQVWMDAG